MRVSPTYFFASASVSPAATAMNATGRPSNLRMISLYRGTAARQLGQSFSYR
jgi:hypothetical protein